MWISAAFLLLALVVNGVKSEGSSCPCLKCPAGWEKFETRCFKFFGDLKPWAEAEKHCIDLGGNLASIHNLLTHNFLKTLLKKRNNAIPRTWIGGHDAIQSFMWFWSDGSKFDYNNWHTGEPNNKGGDENCMEMVYGAEQRWNNAQCGYRVNFICQRAAKNDY